MDLWLIAITLFCLAAVLSSVNFLATILLRRCPGMTFARLPLTVWSWLVSSSLTIIAFSALFIAASMLLADRHCGTSFFLPPGLVVNGIPQRDGSGSPMLWLHLFWFFGHPEVYITILPGMGLASSLLANFTRRPVPAYRFMVIATLLIGFLGLGVWGHHMFVSGMNPYAGTAFGLTTIAIAVPSSAEVLTWLVMLFRGRMRLTTPMLFTLGFLSFFIAGGLTGPILAQPALDAYLHNTFFVVAHFHLVMAMAGVFSVFAGIYYWYPLLTGRRMNETARPYPFLDFPHRRLWHVFPHALCRTRRRAPSLFPAHRNRHVLLEPHPRRARHYLVGIPACRRAAHFSFQCFPQPPPRRPRWP